MIDRHLDSILTVPMGSHTINGDSGPLDVAIIGAGAIGVITALGFLRRGVRVTIYERAPSWPELGFTIALTGMARQCLGRIDPDILEAVEPILQYNPVKTVRYWDGYSPRTKEAAEAVETSVIAETSEADMGYAGCLRSRLLGSIAPLLAKKGAVVRFEKQLVGYYDNKDSGKVKLTFTDGTDAEADVVIGSDGVFSTMRRLLLGAEHDAKYAHQLVYRAFVPIPSAVAALGTEKANTQTGHMGPGAYIMSFPITTAGVYAIVLQVHDPEEWSHGRTSVVPATRTELLERLTGWGPHVQELAALVPEQFTKWGVFDIADPTPTYSTGRVCIAGDAAHASPPTLACGATVGIEDALALVEVLSAVGNTELLGGTRSRNIEVALREYSDARRERGLWVVRAARRMADVLQWRDGEVGKKDEASFLAAYEENTKKIWNVNEDAMVDGLVDKVKGEIETSKASPA